ncbi:MULTISPECIES: 3-dehydroshikimate dehydratase QuiC [Pseudomonas]|jgi:4-hydroxyphenylpyruvate dioxygenase|uniref:3-dehydroshikimate dehydratase n=2 Tax=Pseudomonas chlororaphis TaxID=587753 RepID=A0AAQ1F822_9PSED|nr:MULTISPECIES: 3-dehydroshikimate dehydratase QuiC [Pseudomonas]AIC22495.1 4-hydroxyphenylpyruvate dioxygenase [Pseudomonas chlororaphis]AIS10941.1 4-hydroxyphenylpyruvate dioxygenase [Pseudomonas chlororaphis subsp. aurantiaca]AUG43298.1 4-hydroxyphenylpyruvate dioxygenase [Pseudomonas chlororaphis]AZD50936.1 4-hydroxyphenylpyruvate dioxygenase [Pseudomonas chlororaphis subsp. aurantiaca]AZD69565.1 4-hydroxyphenylpyruvate dioxygenase [Pseudomonas chlororaphis subsp. aurantiaca]
MQRSIATVSLSGTLPEKLEAIAAAGFDGVEIFENDLLYYDGSPREIRQMCADLGIAITLFQPFRDFEGCRRDRLQRNLERAERKFDLMQELGTDLVLVCSNAAADSVGDRQILVDDLRLLAERAGSRGLRIGYEALAWGRHVNTYQQVWDIVREADHPSLGVLLDSFHTLSLKGDPAAIAEIPGDKIFFVQMADAPILAMDVLEWSRHFRCFPGQGDFDLPGFLAPIIKSGYTGPLSLEIFNDGFRAAPPRANAADGLRSLLYLEEKTRQRLAQEATPVANIDTLFAPPPASEYGGTEFLEFAVDEALGAKLGGWLERLGFAKAGQHRSKNVSLMRQGDINLILNSEPYSFAHSFFEAHGPSVCATAIRVKDSAKALERAVAYKGQPYRGLVGPNELELAAVRELDGSLIYLVDQEQGGNLYDTDFNMLPGVVAKGGLKRIDHMAMALPADNLDSWVLFYKSLLDFTADDEVVLPDPYGLVKSRALRSRCSTIRLPLNISENRKTAISHALSSYGGSGVHHIAFDCDDIFAEVSRAKEAGVPLLDIPLNYYDDLAARFDFDDEFLSELAYYNVLYDRDAQGGELFHVYTEPFEGRFFFEIIQRKNGYVGYGAANVAVRLAAMAKSRSGGVRQAKL